MTDYVTREDIVSVGATALTDLYDDADPGIIQTPTGMIRQIIYAGIARLDAEGSTLVGGVRLTGDATSGNPVVALGAYGCGASGTATSATVLVGPTVLDVAIPVRVGSNLRIFGLVAGTVGDDIAMSVTLRFEPGSQGRGPLYFTREDTLAIGAQQLTDEFDDGDPPTFLVPQGYSAISHIIVAAEIQEAAADDIATAALQFRGSAISGRPTISLFAGGIGAINTGVGQETATPAIQMPVNIPVEAGKSLQLFGLLAGEAGTIGNMVATAVLV